MNVIRSGGESEFTFRFMKELKSAEEFLFYIFEDFSNCGGL